jgi:pilus assembly protein TadC
VENDLPCPNCGEPLGTVPIQSEFTCKHCGEILALSADDKVVLARPIQTYLQLDDEPQDPVDGESASIPEISARRRKKAIALAYERIAQEKKDVTRGFFYGVFFLVFGTIFLATSFSRLVLISNDWLNLVGFAFGLIFAVMGAYLALWFRKLSRSLSREEKTIKEEIIHSG